MARPTPTQSVTQDPPPPPYDRHTLLGPDSPVDPIVVRDALRTLMQMLPIDPEEPRHYRDRRMYAAVAAFTALYPRDEIEVMLAVQAVAAHHAAAAAMRLGMNQALPNGQGSRHLSAAASQVRVFDSTLKALERRQARPLALPAEPRVWPRRIPGELISELAGAVTQDEAAPPDATNDNGIHDTDTGKEAAAPDAERIVWSEAALEAADKALAAEHARRMDAEDLGPVEGVMPDGSIIVPETPTPAQEAYIGERLIRNALTERTEQIRQGRRARLHLPPIRPGDRIA